MIAEIKNDIKIIRFQGAILRKDSDKMESELIQSSQWFSKKVILDFTDVHHICSSALGVLVSFKRRIRNHDGEVKIVLSDEDIRQVFEITMLDKVFEIYSDIELASQSF